MQSKRVRKIFLCAVAVQLLSLFATFAFACQPPRNPIPAKSHEEELASTDLIVSGRVVARVDDRTRNLFTIKFEVVKYIKGKGPKLPVVQSVLSDPCDYRVASSIAAGEWWTLYLNKSDKNATYFVRDMETFCAGSGVPETTAPLGHCRSTLAIEVWHGRYIFAPNTVVVTGPNRDVRNVWSATLSAGSSFDGIQLPQGTIVKPRDNQLTLVQELSIGPIKLHGRVRLGNFNDYKKTSWPGEISAAYFAETDRSTDSPKNLLVYGAETNVVYFRMPGAIVTEAHFSRPVFLQGYHVSDFALFSDGHLKEFRSARNQVVGSLKIKECDIVVLIPLTYPFNNPCNAH
jgi:hypothetical protein